MYCTRFCRRKIFRRRRTENVVRVLDGRERLTGRLSIVSRRRRPFADFGWWGATQASGSRPAVEGAAALRNNFHFFRTFRTKPTALNAAKNPQLCRPSARGTGFDFVRRHTSRRALLPLPSPSVCRAQTRVKTQNTKKYEQDRKKKNRKHNTTPVSRVVALCRRANRLLAKRSIRVRTRR